jgi:hypothetical protein
VSTTVPVVSTWSFIDGTVDEVRVWNVQRTPAEIQSTMDTVAVGNEPGLVSLWHLSDGAGTVAHDSSPSANNGALSGYDDGGLPQWVPSNAPIF